MEITDGVYFGGISVMVNTTGCGPVGMSSILVFHPICPCDENGRRGRLRICCLKRRAGSNPVKGTISLKSN